MTLPKTILVTGGAGFIGSAVIRHIIQETDVRVVNLDKLTYAANPDALRGLDNNPRYAFEKADICDRTAVDEIFSRHKPDAVMHLAAESHVDRSIDGPADFIETNIVGSYVMLEAARLYWSRLDATAAQSFRYHHISTDEVYGSLGPQGFFTEASNYQPNSPYSASKASSDMLARAWHHTYGLPVVITNCSNNYGPWQFPEKLIPLVILNALGNKPLPIYGDGLNVRDWLYVEDHARALWAALTRGRPGETYAIGGRAEATNIDLVRSLCRILDELRPDSAGPYERLINFVPDRPGHDRRYAIDSSKIERELGWRQSHDLQGGLRATVRWYLEQEEWWRRIQAERYAGERLGLASNKK